MPHEKLSRRKLLKRGLAFGTLALAGDAFGIEPQWIDVRRVEVPIQGLGAAFDGYRISLFSDIHYPRNIDRAYVHRVVGLANAFDPDLIAIPGDFLDAKGIDWRDLPDMTGLYDGLRARDGILHRVIRRGDDALAVGGVEDLYFGKADPVRAFAGLSEHIPRILLSHNPDVAEDRVWPVRIDLQLSGHTHGGEIRLPFGDAPFIPSKYGSKFQEGLVQGRSHRVYVTRGVASPRHIRLFCRPEVTHLTLRRG